MSNTQFTLTHPDGRQWHGDSPLKVCAAAQRDLIPPDVAMKRILDGLKMTAEDEKELEAHLALVEAARIAVPSRWLKLRRDIRDSARKLMGFSS